MVTRVVLIVLSLVFAPLSLGQVGGAGVDNARSNWQVLAMGLYPPDLVMRHQQALGITDSQRSAMLAHVKKFQDEVAELQWTLDNEQQIFRQAVAATNIDSSVALPQAQRMLALESKFKLAHFELLIAVKNELSEKQIDMIQQRLQKLREERRK